MTDIREAVASGVHEVSLGAAKSIPWAVVPTDTKDLFLAVADAAISAIEAAGFAVVSRTDVPAAMVDAVTDQAWASGYCTERPQRVHSGGSALFEDDEAIPLLRAALAAAPPLTET